MTMPVENEKMISNSETGLTTYWLYFSFEFLISLLISGFVAILGVIKSLLPKPPRDLTGDTVLIVGASSTLGESLIKEFAEKGCSVIYVNNLRSVEEITAGLQSRRRRVQEIGPEHRKHEPENSEATIVAYECDLLDRNAIFEVAKKIEDEVGSIDVLVVCVDQTEHDIFDLDSTTFISYYWTMLAFVPSLLRRDDALIVGVIPVVAVEDIYLNSRTTIAGLMGCLGQEISNYSSRLTYIGMSQMTEHRSSLRETEQQFAMEIIQAVRGNLCAINISWWSKILYRVSYVLYNAITAVKKWFYHDYDYPF